MKSGYISLNGREKKVKLRIRGEDNGRPNSSQRPNETPKLWEKGEKGN